MDGYPLAPGGRILAAGPRAPLSFLDGLAAVILLAIAVSAAFTFRDYGLGWDDYTHSQYGDLLVALYGSGFTDLRALSWVNLYMYGGGFDLAAALAAKILPFDLFETRRLVGAIVGLGGLAATWRLGRHVAGPLGGLIALILLAICPLYYGHMFMNAKDAPFAAAMALLLLGLVRAFEEYPRPSPSTVVAFGIGLGLTIGSRAIGGMAAIYAAAAAALVLADEARMSGWRIAAGRMGAFASALVPGLVLGYLVLGLVWPWGVVAPLNPLRAVAYFSHFFEEPWQELYGGALVIVGDMPRSYVPTLFALQMPEVYLVLTLTGIGAAFVTAAKRVAPLPRRAVLLLLAVAATFPIAYAVATRPAMYNGIRHFVFVTPAFAALGGLAGTWLFAWLARHGRIALIAGTAVFGALVMVPVVDFARLHPYEYTHFNRLAGGVGAAAKNYMLDYWGLAFKQASIALKAKLAERNEQLPDTRPWKIGVCGPHPPARVALGPQFEPTWDPRGADFAMMLGVFYCAEFDAPILAEIVREGVVYARVYDIRGRSFTSLVKVPPVTRSPQP